MLRNKGAKRLLGAFFILSVLSLPFSSAALAEEKASGVQEMEDRLKSLKAKMEEAKRKLLETTRKEQKELKSLTQIQQKLVQSSRQLKDTRFQLSVTENEIGLLSQKIGFHQKQLEVEKVYLMARLRDIYMNKDVDYLEMAFLSNDPTEFLTRYYYLEQVLSQDQEIVQSVEEKHKVLQGEKKDLEQKKSHTQVLISQISQEQKSAAKQKTAQEAIVKKLQTDKAFYEESIRQFEKDSNEIEALIRQSTATRKESAIVGSTGKMIWPVANHSISSNFGPRTHPVFKTVSNHSGIDFPSPSGSTIKAADGGKVLYAGWYGAYGRVVIIDHGKDIVTLYGHCSELYVEKGDQVRQGQKISAVGSTGYSTGPHLHFEVRVKGTPVNPIKYLK